MTLREAVKRANRNGLAVLKPGYPTGRGVLMVLDRGRKEALASMEECGYASDGEICGHDYNYGGGLHRFRKAGTKGGRP